MTRSMVAWFALAFGAGAVLAQGTAEQYRRADERLQAWRRAASASTATEVRWLPEGGAWFVQGRGDARRYVRVDVDGTVRRASDAAELGIVDQPRRLEPQRRTRPSRSSGRRSRVTFENQTKRTIRLFWVDTEGRSRPYGEIAPGARKTQSTYVGHVWVADFAKDDLVGVFVAEAHAVVDPGLIDLGVQAGPDAFDTSGAGVDDDAGTGCVVR